MGPAKASSALRTCLGTGADRAIHVKNEALSESDPVSLARIIHAAVNDHGFSLILAELQADDDNHTQVGPLVARFLDWPCATTVMSLSMQNGSSIRVGRELENNRLQVVDPELPALATVQTGINTPRYASAAHQRPAPLALPGDGERKNHQSTPDVDTL